MLERAGLITRGREAQWRPRRLEAAPLREVTEWADAVDLRDDIGRELGRETQINDALFVMSSPELLDEDFAVAARGLLADLQGAG